MPLPTPLIHVLGLFRPSQLRPHLRVPSIAALDYPSLRRAGFNAVVIDKDNCITHPSSEHVWPPFQDGWARLLRAFEPGRVLVVSNSSGTRKDPGGVSVSLHWEGELYMSKLSMEKADFLSRNLGAPVLLHQAPKPGCAPDVVDYFADRLGAPRTFRAPSAAIRRVAEEEQGDERALLERWRGAVDGPLCGRRRGAGWAAHGIERDGSSDGRTVEHKMVQAENDASLRAQAERDAPPVADATTVNGKEQQPLRVLVIGDRLFTDVLLARQLSKLLPRAPASRPSALAIQTTSLPKPDVYPLRRLESLLTRDKLARSDVDWSVFDLTRRDKVEAEVARRPRGVRDRLAARVRGYDPRTWERPPISWSPRTWRPYPLAFYTTLYTSRATSWVVRRGVLGARWLGLRASRVWEERKQRVGTAPAVVEQK